VTYKVHWMIELIDDFNDALSLVDEPKGMRAAPAARIATADKNRSNDAEARTERGRKRTPLASVSAGA
jgi:hypothetical protein